MNSIWKKFVYFVLIKVKRIYIFRVKQLKKQKCNNKERHGRSFDARRGGGKLSLSNVKRFKEKYFHRKVSRV